MWFNQDTRSLKKDEAIVWGIKVICLFVFSSGYKEELFKPFIASFLDGRFNPWHYYSSAGLQNDAFPYPPLMLFTLAISYFPAYVLNLGASVFGNFMFNLPLIIADYLSFRSLNKIFPGNRKIIFLTYCLSPILFYSTYLHTQLDIIPICGLLAALLYLKKNNLIASSLLIGVAIALKHQAVAAIPLIVIFVYKGNGIKAAFQYLIVALSPVLLLSLPYVLDRGYFEMVLSNPRQKGLFDAIFEVGESKIYLVLLAALILMGRFLAYKKTNINLLISLLGVSFATFIFFLQPQPGWYLWLVPFLTLFIIKQETNKKRVVGTSLALGGLYIIYFLIFHPFDYTPIIANNYGLQRFEFGETSKNIIFTLLEFSLLGNVYLMYSNGVRNNSVYKRKESLVIGIGGDSGSGKSSLLLDLKGILGNKLLELEGDGDHKWERGDDNWQTFTHLDPKANFLHRQTEQLFKLKKKEVVFRSDYDHGSGKFTQAKKIGPQDFIVLSGLHPFYLPKMRKLIDLKIYLDTQEELRRFWKIRRDTVKRGYSPEKIIAQIEGRMSDAHKYIYPQKQFADVIVNYFTDDELNTFDTIKDPSLKVRISCDASIHLEGLVDLLYSSGHPFEWDYEDNLQNQYIGVDDTLESHFYENAGRLLIKNPEELLVDEPKWNKGIKGMIQLICLISLSTILQEE